MRKKYTAIKKTLPLKEQETNIGRMRGDSWRVDTSEPAFARALQRRGYLPVDDDGVESGLVFELPPKALTIRSREAIENPHQAENLPNGSGGADERPQESTKAGQDSGQDRAIDNKDDSSPAPTKTGPESSPESPKVEEVTDDGFEVSSVAKTSQSARGSS